MKRVFLEKIILLTVITLPFYSVGIFISGKYISQSHLFSVMIAIGGFLMVAQRGMKLPRTVFSWANIFIVFLCVDIFGILGSPYGTAVWFKGTLQLLGMLVMIFMGVTVSLVLHENPSFLLKLARAASISLGMVAVIGCLQFVFWNFTPFHQFLKFNFMNVIAGGQVWEDPGYIGSLHRVNSVASEPTSLAHYLAFSLGWSLIRLGILGRNMKISISKVMPLWAAIACLTTFAISISINAWLLVICTASMMLFGIQKIRVSRIVMSGFIAFLMGILFVVVVANTNGGLESKIQTISVISGNNHSDYKNGEDLSALAVASNITVAIRNFSESPWFGGGLGSHPIAYNKYAPSYVVDMHTLNGLNKDDAASLFLRLLSETGMVGLALYIGAMVWMIMRARKAILQMGKVCCYDRIYVAISMGVLASTVGEVFIYLIRTGRYFDPIFWMLIALTASIPMVLYTEAVHGVINEQQLINAHQVS